MNKERRYQILLGVFFAIFIIACVFLLREIVIRRQAVDYLGRIQTEYKPTISENSFPNDTADTNDSESENTENPTVAALVEQYPDVVGWLTVDGADVSHPFVLGEDNAEYLRADLDGSYIITGSLFMDYRCSRDLTDSISIIYGHNMQDKTMFGKLSRYLDGDFLLENSDVYVSLPDKTIHCTAFASMVEDASDSPIYEGVGRRDSISDVVSYILSNADYLNSNVAVDGNSRLLILSTCNPLYFTARTILICVIDEE